MGTKGLTAAEKAVGRAVMAYLRSVMVEMEKGDGPHRPDPSFIGLHTSIVDILVDFEGGIPEGALARLADVAGLALAMSVTSGESEVLAFAREARDSGGNLASAPARGNA